MQFFWIHITKFASSYSYPCYFYVKVLSILSQVSFTRTFKAEPFFLSNYICKWCMLNQSVNIGKLGFNWKSDKESYVRSSLWVVNVWGKHFKLPQLTHESFLTIDHSCKIFFSYLAAWNVFPILSLVRVSTSYNIFFQVEHPKKKTEIKNISCFFFITHPFCEFPQGKTCSYCRVPIFIAGISL